LSELAAGVAARIPARTNDDDRYFSDTFQFMPVYTGPIDAYFDYRFGRLPYRSLRFEHAHLPEVERYQPVGTVNYPTDMPLRGKAMSAIYQQKYYLHSPKRFL
jgi:UDP-galactopyranose mutase